MKLQTIRFQYEPPALEIIPETDFEAATLDRYWKTARLDIGMAARDSANGKGYSIRFLEPPRAATEPQP